MGRWEASSGELYLFVLEMSLGPGVNDLKEAMASKENPLK
jgi:hypothetical protein